ncbi:MAG: cytochrome b/b6 domain-containing protein [Sphingomonadales bacterium]
MDGERQVQGGDLVKRHRLFTRVWHWVNAVAVIVMLMSGLMISNAHPRLYWGEYGANFDKPWLDLTKYLERGWFPGWATIPSNYSLAEGRHWHLAFAWVMAFGFLAFLVVSLINRHIQRDLALKKSELAPKHLLAEIVHHAQLKFPTGAAALNYNTLQKITYILVLFGLFPMLILTGLCLQPGLSPLTGWAIDLFSGRATARSIHFICAGSIALFIVVHLTLVILAGPFNEIRSMITGKFRVPHERELKSEPEIAGEPA